MPDRCKVIVAFCDILGFTEWTRRATNTPEVTRALIDSFYDPVQKFLVQNPYCQMKYQGDGVMILKELKGLDENSSLHFFNGIVKLNNDLGRVVASSDFPRPQGFRTRLAASVVHKKELLDPYDGERRRKVWEFIGYGVNLAQRLLEVSPQTPILFHESVIEVLGREAKRIKCVRFKTDQPVPRGLDPLDLQELWTLRA